MTRIRHTRVEEVEIEGESELAYLTTSTTTVRMGDWSELTLQEASKKTEHPLVSATSLSILGYLWKQDGFTCNLIRKKASGTHEIVGYWKGLPLYCEPRSFQVSSG